MSNTEVPVPTPEKDKVIEEKAQMNFFQRLIGVLFSPGETFQDINRKPSWFLPIIFSVIFVVGANALVFYRLNPDWNKVATQVMDAQKEKAAKSGSSPPELTKEQQEQQIKAVAAIMRFNVMITPFILPIIYILIHTLVFWGATVLMGGITTFKKVLSATGFINAAVTFGVQFLLTIIVVFIRNPDDINFMKGIVATNPGMLIPEGSNPFLVSFLSRFDIFTIWTMILMIIALKIVCQNIKSSTATTVVLAIWGIYIIIATLLGGIFG